MVELAIVPSTELDAAVEALTVVPETAEAGVTVNAADGGTFIFVYAAEFDIWFFSEGLPTAFTNKV